MNERELLKIKVKTKVGPSKIHGVGLFALRDLVAGETLYADEFPKQYSLTYNEVKDLPEEISEVLLSQWPNIVNGSKFIYPTTRLQAFINHSNKPNYDAVNDVMLKDVKKGQEITEDYRLINNYQKIFLWL